MSPATVLLYDRSEVRLRTNDREAFAFYRTSFADVGPLGQLALGFRSQRGRMFGVLLEGGYFRGRHFGSRDQDLEEIGISLGPSLASFYGGALFELSMRACDPCGISASAGFMLTDLEIESARSGDLDDGLGGTFGGSAWFTDSW